MNCGEAGRGETKSITFRPQKSQSAFYFITKHELCPKNQCSETETIYCLQWTIKATGNRICIITLPGV